MTEFGLQEMERMFCPACGNAALEKVEVVVGKDGAEVYGVRKRHIIRGTRFSLPKPKARFDSSKLWGQDFQLLLKGAASGPANACMPNTCICDKLASMSVDHHRI